MIDVLAWIVLLPVGIPTLILIVELMAAQLPARRTSHGDHDPRIAIVIPAHDEEDAIAATVAAIHNAAPVKTRLIVVADNCSDATAARAAEAGAEIVERTDPDRRGKGYALAAARDWLAEARPDIVILIDADCTIEPGGIAALAAMAAATDRPVQSAYLMRPRPDLGAMVAISGFAFLLRNLVRQRGLARIGAPALFTGSGAALPWAAFATAPLARDDLVEDLAIGVALAEAGGGFRFAGHIRTWSDPARRGATFAQRQRWEHGFLRSAARAVPRLIASGRPALAWLGFHLLVPPIALLALLDLAALALLAMFGSCVPLAILSGALALLAMLLTLSWARFGRAQVRAATLLAAPFYLLWKLPLYLGALLRPERRWIRTRRD